MYHIYLDRLTRRYEIYQSAKCEVDTYSPDQHEYYFAVFVRAIDASNYVKHENGELEKRK